MQNHEIWRRNYLQHRYMEFLSEKDLHIRANDIFSNLIILSPAGKVSLRDINSEGEDWMILWTEILEEFRVRYGDYPKGFGNSFAKEANIPKSEFSKKAKKVIDKIGGIKSNCIYKYSKYEYNQESLKFGRFRIAPASYYKDSSLNYAINDDELIMEIHRHPKNISITNISNGSIINPISNIIEKYELKTNYYVQCFSSQYTYREYDDFEADSCLIIYDVDKFISKVREVFFKQKLNFDFYCDSVDYIDPLKPTLEPTVFFSKHFKYSYQNEFRTVFIPKFPMMNLEVIYIEIGSMEDYAKLVKLEE